MQPDPLRFYKELDELGEAEVRAKIRRGEYSVDALPIVHIWLQLKAKPHWSVTPLFWVSVVGAVAAIVAAYYAYLTYSQPQQLSVFNPQSQNEPSATQKPSPRFPPQSLQ